VNINIIDKDTVSVDGDIFKRVVSEDEPLICTLDGYEYYLGPECLDDLPWQEAFDWCKSLGNDYELPNRIVMLAACVNPTVSSHIKWESYYWTSTEFETSCAWLQYWASRRPGIQSYDNKSAAFRVRAVRKVKAGSK
jgi:hypothetical protein